MLNSLRKKFGTELASTHEISPRLSSDFTGEKLPLLHHENYSSRQDLIKLKSLLFKNPPFDKYLKDLMIDNKKWVLIIVIMIKQEYYAQ